jgi:hypothetical protein
VARRSPLNARYQKYTEPAGKTRKSAAAAKPARKSAEPAPAGASKSKGSSARGPVRVDPQTPEFKRIRRIWWGSLIVGVVLVTASWALRSYAQAFAYASTVANVTLVLAYACIAFALYLDFAKMRPMRQAAKSGGGKAASSAKKTVSKDDTDD